jgi:hypothetical protein
MWKIQGLVCDIWQDDAVARNPEDNLFETEHEAQEQIPILARVLDCAESQLRVVEA